MDGCDHASELCVVCDWVDEGEILDHAQILRHGFYFFVHDSEAGEVVFFLVELELNRV